jgi:hypothetical protein
MVKSSANSPNGQLFSETDLSFSKGFGFDTLDAQTLTNVPSNCFTIQAREGAMEITETNNEARVMRIEFKQYLRANVYTKCIKATTDCNPYDKKSCCLDCTISFGKEIKD